MNGRQGVQGIYLHSDCRNTAADCDGVYMEKLKMVFEYVFYSILWIAIFFMIVMLTLTQEGW
jgi:hypothetical protein